MKIKKKKKDSGQDGGIGRYTLPPCTAKTRTTTNLKTKTNQNCQKIELYGSPTTKELKKKHSSRQVGGVETGSKGREDIWRGGGWQTMWSHICMWISQEEQLGSEAHLTAQDSSVGKESLKTSSCKNWRGETHSLTGEFLGETHRVLECTQTHPLGKQHQKGPTDCG